jgi:diguanylate cyclase (GGDEF)-like protein
MRSDVKYRAAAVIDPLTGMLNRQALAQRAAEFEAQAGITGQSVGVILGDIDHFKHVNDSHGHAAGDAVLKGVAYELRKQLRTFDLCYRIGGEEFVVLVPGAELDQAIELAEHLRGAIAASPHGGLPVTMSFGVSASDSGAAFVYDTAFAAADAGLYAAKRAGRNRVCTEPSALTTSAPVSAGKGRRAAEPQLAPDDGVPVWFQRDGPSREAPPPAVP